MFVETRQELDPSVQISTLTNYNGKLLIADEDSGIILLDSKNEIISDKKLYQNGAITDLETFEEPNCLIGAGKMVVLWDFEKEQEVMTCIGHKGDVLCVKGSPLHNYFASGDDDKNIFIWDKRTPKPINFIQAHSTSITSIDIFLDGSLIVSTSDEGYW